MWDEMKQQGASRLAARLVLSRSKRRATGRGNSKEECGGYLVEYAFVFIISVMILFGIIGFGHALYAYHFVSHAARDAARYATVRGSTCESDLSCAASNSASGTVGPTTKADIQSYVRSIAPPGINSTGVTVTVCGVKGAAACAASVPDICTARVGVIGPFSNYPGCTVQVQVRYTFNFIVPLVSTSRLALSSSSDLIIIH